MATVLHSPCRTHWSSGHIHHAGRPELTFEPKETAPTDTPTDASHSTRVPKKIDGKCSLEVRKVSHNELKALESTIERVKAELNQPSAEASLSDVATALERLDPIWDVLVSDERRRILELLIEGITVSRDRITI